MKPNGGRQYNTLLPMVVDEDGGGKSTTSTLQGSLWDLATVVYPRGWKHTGPRMEARSHVTLKSKPQDDGVWKRGLWE